MKKVEFRRIHTRKLDRLVAKAKIRKAGMSKVFKKHNCCRSPRETKIVHKVKRAYGRSYFSDNWRKIAGLEA